MEDEFLRAYGPSGLWQDVLSRAVGFFSTEAWCESTVERRFRTADVWLSHDDFEAFRRDHQAECERVKRFVADAGIVEREILLGTFYEGPDEDDAGLVTT